MANSNVTLLNGRTATAVALVLFNFAFGAIATRYIITYIIDGKICNGQW